MSTRYAIKTLSTTLSRHASRPRHRARRRAGRLAPRSRSSWSSPSRRGGTSDQTGRAFQAAIKENGICFPSRSRSSTSAATTPSARRQVKEAAADGYNFLLIHIALMGGEGSGVLDFGYRDFEPVAATAEFCLCTDGAQGLGYQTRSDAAARTRPRPSPDSLIFGANLGAINHMAGHHAAERQPGREVPFRADRRRHRELHRAHRRADQHDRALPARRW